MYKITLFDDNCASCTSGTASFYVDDIDIFEEKWSKLERSPERIERFRRSKSGELVTDYYPTDHDEELNIVQEDKDAEILHEKHLVYHNKVLRLVNSYDYECKYHVRDLDVLIRYIRYNDNYLKIALYKMRGIASYAFFSDFKYCETKCYGNSILEFKCNDLYSNKLSDFDDSYIESIAFLPIKGFKSLKDMEKNYNSSRLSEFERNILFCDIPGEAG